MKIIELLKKIAFMAVMVGSLSLLGCGEEEAGHEDHGDHKEHGDHKDHKDGDKKAAPAPEKKAAAPAPAKAPEKKPASTEKPK